ncbi:MAG: nitroreductase family protein [Candidatus Hermodarchaeota archaeon]
MQFNSILELIKNRRSRRSSYDLDRPVSKESLNNILEAARWAPTPHNMQNFEIIVIDDKEILQAIGNIKFTISNELIRENYQQLSFSEEEFLRKKVGVLGTRLPPAFRNPNGIPENEKMTFPLGRNIQASSYLLIIIYNPNKRAPASPGDFLGIVGLGCIMENMWLMAQSMGIAFHVVSALNANTVEKEVKKLLDIPDHMKIAFGVRLGYAHPTSRKYLRVRRDIDDFVHYNKFVNKNK